MNPLKLPKLTKHVTDFSGVLPPAQVESLSVRLLEHENSTSEEIVIVFFPHREGNELIDIGMKIFNENSIGQKHLNNGLLLIIATEEKKIRIITGKGMEIKYNEMRCRYIIENNLRPLLDNDSYDELVQAWLDEICLSEKDGSAKAIYFSEKTIHDNEKGHIVIGSIIGIICIFLVNGYISGFIGLLVGALLYYGARYNKNRGLIRPHIYPYALIGPILVIATSILAFLMPGNCTMTKAWIDGSKDYACERNIFGYQYKYTMSSGGSSGNSRSSTNDSDSSSSSSYDGGGGSSNGGGYGD